MILFPKRIGRPQIAAIVAPLLFFVLQSMVASQTDDLAVGALLVIPFVITDFQALAPDMPVSHNVKP